MISTLTGNKDLDINILNNLDDKNLVSFCSTSKYANQLCNDQILWQRRTIDRFGDIISLDIMKKYKGDSMWSDYYIELSQKIRSHMNMLLIISSEDGRLDLTILALNQGANVSVGYDIPLRLASTHGHLDVVKYLVSKGADVSVEDDFPLKLARQGGHLELVKYLEEHKVK